MSKKEVMIKLLKNANVYAPAFLGRKDILIVGEKICRIDERIEGYEGSRLRSPQFEPGWEGFDCPGYGRQAGSDEKDGALAGRAPNERKI